MDLTRRSWITAATLAPLASVSSAAARDEFPVVHSETCLNNALRLEAFIGDAEREGDVELMELFQRAQHESKKGATHEHDGQFTSDRIRPLSRPSGFPTRPGKAWLSPGAP